MKKLNNSKFVTDVSDEFHEYLIETLKDTITEIFKTFVFTDVQLNIFPNNTNAVTFEHNAFFYMSSNKMNAVFCVSLNQKSLMELVKKILGDENSSEKEAIDASMELSNVLYGGIKKRMQMKGYTFGLANYQYSKLNSGEELIKDEVRFGYTFQVMSNLGDIEIKILYDQINFATSAANDQNITEDNTVNSTYLSGYLPIKLTDIHEDKKILFDLFLYLRLNKKLLIYKRGGDKVESTVLSRFKNYQVDYFYIRESDQSEYIEYVANKTAGIIKDEKMIVPEKKEKLEKAAIQLISGFFTDPENSGKFLENAQKIVDRVIDEILEDTDPLKKLLSKIKENLKDTETHSINVQTFATVMAMTLGYTTQKALVAIAMGAMFHDIGYSKIPNHLHHKKDATGEDLKLIQQHPTFGVEILSQHKNAIPYEARLIIEQHHENHDGSGYPKGLKGFQTYELSKIVSIANDFESRLRAKGNETPPMEIAFEMFQEFKAGGVIRHDLNLFKKIFQKLTPDIFKD